MTAAGGEPPAADVAVDPAALRRVAQALEAAAPAIADAGRRTGTGVGDAAIAAGADVVAAALVEVAQRCHLGLAALAGRLDTAAVLLTSTAEAHERNDGSGSLLFDGPPPVVPPR